MARLEQAIQTIVDIFLEYSDGDGKLSKDEMKKLFDKEIENPEIKAKIEEGGAKAMRKMSGFDGQVNFKEFSRCVCMMAKCHYHKKTGKGKAPCEEDSE